MIHRLLILAAFSGLTIGAAQAQTVPARSQAAGYFEIRDDRRIIEPFNLTVDQLDDLDVFTAGGERIGELEEVLMDAAGRPVAVSVELGGIAGGDREHIVALDRLRLEGQRLVTDLTRSQLETLPRWDD
ncbi:PRC-barrel domain-containing protein [Plastoroseomonas hellenica]|uniref:PRC-barrel domain-containing protein n=1 Tax=Plastoroseomonas hellenica TaxID=2687306 RepID=UPI001BAB4B03|nr:PRC-barrel domain-containing protein [Plastoroseomonas hellenica]MBR0642859.1 PRC-barrel domain containing protein [Plastoroseomonas hellenica]